MLVRSLFIALTLVLAFQDMSLAQRFRGRANSGNVRNQNQYIPPVQNRSVQNPTTQAPTVVSPQTTQQNVVLHWSQKLLEGVTKEHNFGVVAKASTQRHLFEFKNSLDTEVYLSNARVSCGCTKVQILTPVVKPGETGQIEARFDTIGFSGQRSATVTVGVNKNKPYSEYSELRFSVKGMIRTDVVFDPGMIEFGEVVKGNSSQRSVIVKYAGNPLWKVESVHSSNPNVTTELKEIRRDLAGRIDYQITINLSDKQPVGPLNDMLTLETTDTNNSRIALPMVGRVESMISVSDVQLGMIEKGKLYDKKLIVSGKQPFEILEVKSTIPGLSFSPSSGAKTLHIIGYKFDASKEGLIKDQIVIKTNDPTQSEIQIGFGAQILSETIAVDPKK